MGTYGSGTINLNGGTFNSQAIEIGVGQNPNWGWEGDAAGVGIVNQTGGVHNTEFIGIGEGFLGAGTGTYNMSGGTLNVMQVPGDNQSSAGLYDESGIIELGVADASGIKSPVGTFNQTGGTVNVDWGVIIGSDTTNDGTGWGYGFLAGHIGNGAQGIGTYNFNMGIAGSPGILQEDKANTGYGANLYVRYDAPATGTFQGHGAVALTGMLQNNGRVIANGGTLDMSSFSLRDHHRPERRSSLQWRRPGVRRDRQRRVA